ncbi:hypothetical protein NFJ02_03g100580 [Pycnococcus provasolii]
MVFGRFLRGRGGGGANKRNGDNDPTEPVKAETYAHISSSDDTEGDLKEKLQQARRRSEVTNASKPPRSSQKTNKAHSQEHSFEGDADVAQQLQRRRDMVEKGVGLQETPYKPKVREERNSTDSSSSASPELTEKLNKARTRTFVASPVEARKEQMSESTVDEQVQRKLEAARTRAESAVASRKTPQRMRKEAAAAAGTSGASKVEDEQVQRKLEAARTRAESAAASRKTPQRMRKEAAAAAGTSGASKVEDEQVQRKLEAARARAESAAASRKTPQRMRKEAAAGTSGASKVEDEQVQRKLEAARTRAESAAASRTTPQRERPGGWDTSADEAARAYDSAKGKLRMGAAAQDGAGNAYEDVDVHKAEQDYGLARATLNKTKASSLEGAFTKATSQPAENAVAAGSIAASNFRCPDRRLGELGRVLRKARTRADRLENDEGVMAPIRAEPKKPARPAKYMVPTPPPAAEEEAESPADENRTPSPINQRASIQMMPTTPPPAGAAPSMMPLTEKKASYKVPIKEKAKDEPLGGPVIAPEVVCKAPHSTSLKKKGLPSHPHSPSEYMPPEVVCRPHKKFSIRRALGLRRHSKHDG